MDGDPVTGAAVGTMVLEGGATVVSAGTMLVAASAVAPVALIIYHPEALLTGTSAAQMDLAVERQIRQNAKAPTPLIQ